MSTNFIDHLLTGDHASRPAFGDVPEGTLYACSDHGLVYQSDGSSAWSTWATLGSSGGAPDDVDYLVGTASGDLSAEIAVGTSPGGELGGTWASPTVDATHSGSAHHAEDHASRHEDGGADELEITDLATAETDTDLVLAPDGSGGVEFRAEAGGGSVNAGTPYEVDYVEITSGVAPTTSVTPVITANAVAFDGSTIAIIEFYSPLGRAGTGTNQRMTLILYEDGSPIGNIGSLTSPGVNVPIYCVRRMTPSNASHTYAIQAQMQASTGNIGAGAGGSGNDMPAFLRISKLTV